LYFDRCRADAYAPLVAVIDGECYAPIDAADNEAVQALLGLGFVQHRREHLYQIPVTSMEVAVPAGLRTVTADRTELEPLMMLDCALREDVPGRRVGSQIRVWFREETYDSPFSMRRPTGSRSTATPTWGWRGCGSAAAATAPGHGGRARRVPAPGSGPCPDRAGIMPLVERNEKIVEAEADATNIASNTLLASLGGTVVGGTLDMYRPAN